jgi:hypothetical protein
LINNLRRAEGLPEINFVDGHSTVYSLMRGQKKAAHRQQILTQLRKIKQLVPSRSIEILERAWAAAGSLPHRDPFDFAA